MNEVRSAYVDESNVLHVICENVPKEVRVTKPDPRERGVYTTRVWRFVPEHESNDA